MTPRAFSVLVAACALSLGGGSAGSQTTGRPGLVVKVAPVTLSPGGQAETTVTLEIEKGYRIVAPGSAFRNAQQPILAFDAAAGIIVQPQEWPAGKSWRAVEDDPEVKVYEGRLVLKVTLHAAPQAAVQEVAIQGRVRYQAIKGSFFEKVAVLPLTIPVKVAASAAAAPARPATRP